jgi:hypothetical protein
MPGAVAEPRVERDIRDTALEAPQRSDCDKRFLEGPAAGQAPDWFLSNKLRNPACHRSSYRGEAATRVVARLL